MKRLFMLVFLSLVATSLFAATDKVLNEKAFVEWEFDPEVSTYVGYNLDLGTVGLEGKAKLELTTTVFETENVEFSEDKKPYGYIKIEDLEIKVTAKQEGKGSTEEKYNSTEHADEDKKEPLPEPVSISWGSISGTIYAGPIYVKLAHDGHGNQGFIDSGLDDGDLDYSVINYSIISASQTAQFVGARKSTEVFPMGIVTYRVTDINDEPKAPKDTLASKLAKSNNSFSVGFKEDDVLDVRVGISSAGSYKTYQENNPIQLSLFFELLSIKNLVLKLQATAIAGVHPSAELEIGTTRKDYNKEGGFLSEGNPLTIGTLLGYEIPIGTNTLTPSLGLEVSLENKVDKYSTLDLLIDKTTVKLSGDDKTVDVKAYEAALGIKYDWKSLGNDADESDHLSAPGKDVTVTDGFALGFLYGSMPNDIIRSFAMNYVGVKVSLWDSQDDDKPGMLPVKLGLILNYNYVLGGEYKPKQFKGTVNISTDTASPSNKTIDINKVKFASRQDFGLLLETSMTFGYIKPFFNAALQMYNVTNVDEITIEASETVTGGDTEEKLYKTNKFIDRTDLRVKLGFDIKNLVKNVTFSAWWESGNVMKTDKISKKAYNTSSFYTTKDINASNAKLGFIALGAKISY